MIARAGIGKMTIADADTVDLSNCNRQIPALQSTAGKLKTNVMKERLLDINPDLEITVINEWVRDALTNQILDNGNFDYAVDCIDTLSPKVWFLKACIDRNIPVVCSLGAGGKLDPSKVVVTDISETYQCNLARYVRKKLYKYGVRSGVECIFSPEVADPEKIIVSEKAFPKKSIIGTISYMPAIFGCFAASVVIRRLGN
jgi:tRNA A37 threonylcarbamoyladenosine dehydratase